MVWTLKIEDFGSVLKQLGRNEGPGTSTILWTVFFVVSVPLILVIANRIRIRIRHQSAAARGFEQLEKIGRQKDLNHIEQAASLRLAESANLRNASNLFSSVEFFDNAVAGRVRKLKERPWLEMEAEIERLSSLREKMGFRHIPPNKPPATTRQLRLDQKIFVLAAHKDAFRLLSAPVIDLDDLAIQTGPFMHREHRIHLKLQQEMWAFFWAANGREFRFRTQIYKEVERPVPYLLLQHGDTLFHEKDGELFMVEVQAETQAHRLPSSKAHSSSPGPELFESRGDDTESLDLELTGLSGTGFQAVTDAAIEQGDLLLLSRQPDTQTAALKAGGGLVGRVVETSAHTFRASFVGIEDSHRERVLNLIATRLDLEATQRRFEQKR